MTEPKIGIFVNARPRTGGTLLTAMLNAHSQISMSYELYPQLLEPGVRIESLISLLESSRHSDPLQWVRQMEVGPFRTFAARARRSGLEPPRLLNSLRKIQESIDRFDTDDERLHFIESLMRLQGSIDRKPVVGSKMRADLRLLAQRHPDALFLMMRRDGRDVLASRLTKGNFKQTAADVAEDWSTSLREFEQFASHPEINGHLVHYEQLVADPEETLRPVLNSAGLDFEPSMAAYEEAGQALFDSPHGHLSADQLQSGLNAGSIGRWRELDPAALDEFVTLAGDDLRRFGYLDGD